LADRSRAGPPRLFLIYSEGNFIEAGADTPFFQIGETKYGRPILVRAYDPALTFEQVMKLLLVSFDSTLKANLSVGAPFDFHFYEAGSLVIGPRGRIKADNPYFQTISKGWGDALKDALDSLPDFNLSDV
jgi:putative proteasome-type protease